MVDIDELERLLAAATPGEWDTEFDPIEVGDHATAVCLPGKAGSLGTFLAYCQHNWSDADYSERRISWKEATSNAALIVALHNSAPAMLTEIRELRAENARLNTDLRRCFGGETHAVRNERVMQKIHDYTENALARAALGEPQ